MFHRSPDTDALAVIPGGCGDKYPADGVAVLVRLGAGDTRNDGADSGGRQAVTSARQAGNLIGLGIDDKAAVQCFGGALGLAQQRGPAVQDSTGASVMCRSWESLLSVRQDLLKTRTYRPSVSPAA
jgi:hypothetical protein